jgi:hypothetical protein
MGSALNVGYGLQWPVFAVFFGWIWWRMLRIEIARLDDAPDAPEAPAPEPDAAAPRASAPTDPSPFAYRPGRVRPVSEADDPQVAEYNRMLAELAAQDRDRQRQD